jgi:hypothetical protein
MCPSPLMGEGWGEGESGPLPLAHHPLPPREGIFWVNPLWKICISVI